MRRSQDLTPPDVITTRLDGWIGGPSHIPLAVAEMIARAMPQLGDDTVAIRARMWTRQRMHERESAVLADGDDD